MADVRLCSGDTLYDESNVTLAFGGIQYRSTKKPVTKGKYYYEVTHFGGSNGLIAGFISEKSVRFGVGAPHAPSAVLIYHYVETIYPWKLHQDLNLTGATGGHTFGIGIDIDNFQLYLRLNHQVRVIEFIKNATYAKEKWNIALYEGFGTGNVDYASINFGYKNFKYPVPFGFTPWNKNPSKITCKQSRCKTNNMFIAIIAALMNPLS